MFKSPVLWTGKKPDLDWTGLEKTRLSVVVASFFYQLVAVAGIENLFRTGLDWSQPVGKKSKGQPQLKVWFFPVQSSPGPVFFRSIGLDF